MKHFVCYTTRDKEVNFDLLQSFSNELKKKGDVFIDMIDNDSDDKQNRVLSELDSSDVLVLIETSNIHLHRITSTFHWQIIHLPITHATF